MMPSKIVEKGFVVWSGRNFDVDLRRYPVTRTDGPREGRAKQTCGPKLAM
jgi:hypothetical protein